MADEVAVLLVRLEAQIAGFEKAMARAEARASTASRRITTTFASLNKGINRTLGVVGLGLSAGLIAKFVTNMVKAGEAIGDSADKLGIGTEAFQELAYAADQAGASAEAIGPAFKAMTNFVGEAQRGASAARDELKNLGLTLADLRGKTPDQVFEIFLDRLSKIKDPLQRNAEAAKIFGKAAQDLGVLATLGSRGLDDLRKRAHDLGIVLSDETIRKAQDAGDVLGDIEAAARAAGIELSSQFLDALTSIRNLVTSEDFQNGLKTTASVIASVVKLFADNPNLLQAVVAFAAVAKLTGNTAAGAIAGLGALAVGAIAPTGANKGEDAFINKLLDIERQRGANAAADVAGVPRPRPPGFSDKEFFPNANVTIPGLDAAAKRKAQQLANDAKQQQDIIDEQTKKYLELKKAIEDETAALFMSRKEQFIANEVAKLGTDTTEEYRNAVKKLAGDLYDLTQQQKAVNDAAEFFAETAAGAFENLITGAESFKDVLGDILKALERAVLQSLLLGQGPLAGLFGTAPTGNLNVGGILGSLLGGLFGARQSGGPVMAGRGYRVGEHGTELFVPNVSGQIIPSDKGPGAALVQVHVMPSDYFDVTVDNRSAVQAQKISVEVVRTTGKAEARRRELSE